MAATERSSTPLARLQTHVDTLSSLLDSLALIRAQPAVLISPASTPAQVRSAFAEINAFSASVRSAVAQEAMQAAQDSESADSAGIDVRSVVHDRAAARKRRRITPPVTQIHTPPKAAVLLPPISPASAPPIKAKSLAEFVRTHNQSPHRTATLRIWVSSRSKTHSNAPIVLRATVRDVLVAYINLAPTSSEEDAIATRSVTCVGSREEKKQPHSHSDYLVFQKVSQHFSRVLATHPDASLQILVDLISSYDSLLFAPCSRCRRVIEEETLLPPVARAWGRNGDGKAAARWLARHGSCLDE
ncbi:hypothetical protein BOTBODRAFT_36555 [Botryobasidium botryosum FD-172 SS1]|uniref:Mediator complex subunit 27 n=1 Tax=Botryobasidium botryosum (strain FD-172 SS1) TaxID=930990 RepID=A0A067ME08_BOTB1|nr:hypothetical protein BOTBODRAFT_36555 [Botryobasidium botryosum FD-172 SS1]